MQIFMGQSWFNHNTDFLERALKADRITFSDLGIIRRRGDKWSIEHASTEASAFAALYPVA